MKFLIIILVIILIGVGCTSKNQFMPEKITLKTSDGIEIAGMYRYTGQQKIAILLHMMPATKESWDSFAERLLSVGYASIAVDERGHGESTMNGKLDYKKFSDSEQRAKILDVEAAIEFAKQKGFDESKIVVIGASIGANLAIQSLVEHKNISTAVALSPGLDYHGIRTAPMMSKLHEGQKVVLVASDDDPESFDSVNVLKKQNQEQTILIERSGLGHGTRMTDRDSKLVEEIIMLLP